ncbi:MAG: SDR family oxidoreductase [Planctomycetes bacterium]|nr:SDR family oxidoreductase [Planctomycetota bacterium]
MTVAARDGRPVLVTGATGYIGGRLVPRLLDAGHAVRCLVRAPRKLDERAWARHPRLEIVAGDVGDGDSLARALAGCRAAYYLVHSMIAAGGDYRAHDRLLAGTFAHAAGEAGVERIVYLGGLGETGRDLSEHLSSRREVEQVLGEGGVPVTVLRAAMIVGSGSASFEILRYLVERLPVMVTPRWVRTPCQPVAVRDALFALVACLEADETSGRTLDLGGPDVLTYHEFMRLVAEVRGLPPRLVVPVPLLTPRLSSLWIHLVTPLDRRIARPLAEGLRNPVVCRDDLAWRLMPHEPLDMRTAVAEAYRHLDAHTVETAWSDAGPVPGDPDWSGGKTFVDAWEIDVDASPEAAFAAVCRIGGGHGYHAADWLWHLRGWMDQLVGGPGLRRGRKNPEHVAFGEALDFWRVVDVERPRRIALRAEMKVPGAARLDFEVRERADGRGTTVVQTARFAPKGLLGLAYWYAVLPLHGIVFRGMLDGIRREAEGAREGPRPPVRRVR